jgi:phosphatidylethanolamine/phosphatidyl-N-methylethanolamine N-methyltransferase
MKLYDWWGRHGRLYEMGSWIVFLGREHEIRRKAVDKLGIREGDRVLDLACGSGLDFELLEDGVGPGGKIIALDRSGGMLEAARVRAARCGWGNIAFFRGDARAMMHPPGSLDGAFCSLGLSAMSDPRGAVENVRDALKPGRRFAVLDAKPFEGPARLLNPVIHPVFRLTTNWDPGKDIPAALLEVFGDVRVSTFNGGSLFIAVATKL